MEAATEDWVEGSSSPSCSTTSGGLAERPRELGFGSDSTKKLTLLPLVGLIFYEVSGGPFGIEESVRAGGPLLALLGFLVLPLVWAVPEAMIAAELSTCFPENSGYVAWVTAAFGPFWGFQEGLWSWVSGVMDNAIYPVLLLAYLEEAVPRLKDPQFHWPLLLSLMTLLTYLSYRGLTVVGGTAIVLTGFTLLPFVIFCVLAAPAFDPAPLQHVDWAAVQWGPYLNCIFWNLNYWDSASTFAGEVADPGRTFPRGVAITGLVVIATYLLPLLAAVGVDADRSHWEEGYLGALAFKVGGPVLGWWILVASAIANVGQFEAEMSSDAFQLQGMASSGMLPARLAFKSRHGSPPLCIALSSLGMLLCFTTSFIEVIELLNALYCVSQLLEFAAFVRLRCIAPHLPRPFRVPLGTVGCAAMLLCPTLFVCVILSFASLRTLVFTAAIMCLGPLLYALLHVARKHQWCEFFEMSYFVAFEPGSERTPPASPHSPAHRPPTSADDPLATPLLSSWRKGPPESPSLSDPSLPTHATPPLPA